MKINRSPSSMMSLNTNQWLLKSGQFQGHPQKNDNLFVVWCQLIRPTGRSLGQHRLYFFNRRTDMKSPDVFQVGRRFVVFDPVQNQYVTIKPRVQRYVAINNHINATTTTQQPIQSIQPVMVRNHKCFVVRDSQPSDGLPQTRNELEVMNWC